MVHRARPIEPAATSCRAARAVRGMLIHVTQPWKSKLILAFGLLPGACTVRDAPVPTPQQCPSHATRRSQIAAHHPPAAR
eukprot:scaffold25351_cov34-Phaeocystis_antarctica.AAC.1